MRPSSSVQGALWGLSAAMLFGVSAPLAKRLLPTTSSLMLAGWLYLGGGLGLTFLRHFVHSRGNSEAPLRRRDLGPLILILVTGGILGPVLMLEGLNRLPGVTASLLLNLEGPFTLLLALTLFGEHLERRTLLAAGLIFSGAALIGFVPGSLALEGWGIACLAAACASWALDNNFTQRLSLKDPLALARIKTLGAGLTMVAMGTILRHPFPAPRIILGALSLGAASYGLSLWLDVKALRLLGAAREAAYFATAPFIGAVASLPILGEALRREHAITAALMAVGVGLLIREEHSHEHTHEALEHEHLHVHDLHHQHAHDEGVDVNEPHSHLHRHAPLTHTHPHVSDAHHRHRHRRLGDYRRR